MGALFSLFQKKDVNGLMLGLDGAGKTTLLYSLKLNQIVNTIPTIGFNVEQVKYNRFNLILWDIGGQDKIRGLWKHYYNNVQIIIYMIDSNDTNRIQESKNELHKILQEDQLQNIDAVLIFNNKIDLPNSLSNLELTEILELENIKQNWHIQSCCAIKKKGIYDGLKWLSKQIN